MRFASIIFGWFFLGVGIAGIFLPLLPTTPFLLLSSFFFVRSSPRTHAWLMNHRVFGGYVRDWNEKRGVRPGVKIAAFAMMAVVTVASTLFGDLPEWGLVALYLLVATGAIVVWLLPTVHDTLAAPSPPGTPGGEGWGEGGPAPREAEIVTARDAAPLTPNPSPPEYRGRGESRGEA